MMGGAGGGGVKDGDGRKEMQSTVYNHICSYNYETHLSTKSIQSHPPCLIFFTVYGNGEGVV